MALAFGLGFHRTAEENFWQKRTTRKDLPIGLLADFFAGELECMDDVDWKEQEQSLDATKDQGVKTVRAFQTKVAPGIQPVEVEHRWSMEVGGRDWVITGKTDLIVTQGPIDIKTTGRGLSKPKDDHRFQVGTYVMARRAETGQQNLQGQLEYAIRGKEETISLPVEFGPDLAQRIVSTFDNVAGCISREWWPIFRSHYLCSRKYCSFWEICEQDCGGEVKA